jgi:hypothetical protein
MREPYPHHKMLIERTKEVSLSYADRKFCQSLERFLRSNYRFTYKQLAILESILAKTSKAITIIEMTQEDKDRIQTKIDSMESTREKVRYLKQLGAKPIKNEIWALKNILLTTENY